MQRLLRVRSDALGARRAPSRSGSGGAIAPGARELWREGEADEVPAVERVLGGRPQPWVITPQFYAELVQHYKTSRLCELFSVYVGTIPVTAVARKDRQLLQVISSIHSSVPGF